MRPAHLRYPARCVIVSGMEITTTPQEPFIYRPDSRYAPENLAEISTATVCDLNECAEKMAFYPSPTPGLNAEWEVAYNATQDELMTRSRARRAR
jgi:hypothetical protein